MRLLSCSFAFILGGLCVGIKANVQEIRGAFFCCFVLFVSGGAKYELWNAKYINGGAKSISGGANYESRFGNYVSGGAKSINGGANFEKHFGNYVSGGAKSINGGAKN